MFNLHRLRLLREVQLRGTLAAAAEALGYTPSAVSHQLAALERETGVRLLEPVGRRVRLTGDALTLVEHTERILRTLEEAEADIRASRSGAVRGIVRVATLQTVAYAVIPGVIRRLAGTHPELTVTVAHVAAERALPGLVARDFDVVVHEEYPGHVTAVHDGVESTPITTDPIWLASSTADPVAQLTDAAPRRWVLEPEGTLVRRWALSACRSAGFEPRIAYQTSDVLLHLRFVAETGAVALVPGLALRAGGLEGVHFTPASIAHRTLSISIRRGSSRAPAIAAVTMATAEQLRA